MQVANELCDANMISVLHLLPNVSIFQFWRTLKYKVKQLFVIYL